MTITTAPAFLDWAVWKARSSQRRLAALRSVTSCRRAASLINDVGGVGQRLPLLCLPPHQGNPSLLDPGMFNVTKTTLDCVHMTFSTNCASEGTSNSWAWDFTSFLTPPMVYPGFGKNRLRTTASSFNGYPLADSFVLWQSVHSLSPG